MKKFAAMILAVLMLAAILTGCGTKGAPLSKIEKAGKLVIATSPDFPPFESLSGDGKVEGIEIDVLEMICNELGVELEIRQMDFEAVLPGVQANKFDMGVPASPLPRSARRTCCSPIPTVWPHRPSWWWRAAPSPARPT